MASTWAKDRRQRFYLLMALYSLAAVLIGFSTTYFAPVSRGTFTAPLRVHAHGISAMIWIAVLIGQVLSVRSGRTILHMAIGKSALPLAAFIWASGILTAAWAARRDLPDQGIAAETSFFGTVSGLTIFLGFVIAAYLSRRDAAAHKRWMVLATIAVTWPAIFRWRHLLPAMDRPDIVLGYFVANAPILVAMLRDRFRFGQVHPVWLIGGLFWVVEQGVEIIMFETHWSAPAARALLAILP